MSSLTSITDSDFNREVTESYPSGSRVLLGGVVQGMSTVDANSAERKR